MPIREAVELGGRTRLRPILMTSIATMLGLVPMAIGLGEGGELQAPLARVVDRRAADVDAGHAGARAGRLHAVRGRLERHLEAPAEARLTRHGDRVSGSSRTIRLATELDTALLAVPRRIQHLVLLGTVIVIVLFSLPRVPRQYADLSHLTPRVSRSRPATVRTRSPDMYGAKVVLNDVADMYAKARLEQTPLEASTWTKEESAPYPPAVRLTQAAMFAVGEWTGIGFYGLTLMLAALFLATSAWYFLQTRWYLFPLLYLNFAFFADRFVYVQDGSYLVMLACVMGALVLTRRRHQAAPLLMALATTMKLLPLVLRADICRGLPADGRRLVLCRHPDRRPGAAVLRLGQLSRHLSVRQRAQGQRLAGHCRRAALRRPIHAGALVRGGTPRLRCGRSRRLEPGAVRDARRRCWRTPAGTC